MTNEPDEERARELIDYWTPLLLRMCVDTGVIEAFGRQERSAEAVATVTDTHADTLARAIRALASRGVFTECDGGRYRLTDLGRRFLVDEPGSIAGFAFYKTWDLHAWAEAGTRCERVSRRFPCTSARDIGNG